MAVQVKEWTGWEIRELRRGLRLTQVAFAKLLDVHAMTITYWERRDGRSRKHPSLVHMRLLDMMDGG